MREIQLVNRNQIFDVIYIFVHRKLSGSTKINQTQIVHHAQNFPDAVKLRTRAIVNKIAFLETVVRPPVIRHNNRKPVEAIRRFFFEGVVFHSKLKYRKSAISGLWHALRNRFVSWGVQLRQFFHAVFRMVMIREPSPLCCKSTSQKSGSRSGRATSGHSISVMPAAPAMSSSPASRASAAVLSRYKSK